MDDKRVKISSLCLETFSVIDLKIKAGKKLEDYDYKGIYRNKLT